MNSYDPSQLTRRRADQLLDHAESTATDPLSQLLVAAAAPATGRELGGEQAAVAQFRALANGAAAPTAASKTRNRNPFIAKLLIAAAATVVVTGGGVAVAAATGHLPSLPTHVVPTTSASVGGDHQNSRSTSAVNASAHVSAHSTPTTTHQPSSSPDPSMKGLCTAYLAHGTSNPGNSANDPAFSALITAAGGAANVESYCASLTGDATDSPSSTPTSEPTSTAKTHPNGPTNTHAQNTASHPGNGNSTHPPAKP